MKKLADYFGVMDGDSRRFQIKQGAPDVEQMLVSFRKKVIKQFLIQT
jgi:hypothetical protein